MNKNHTITLVLIIITILGFVTFLIYSKSKNLPSTNEPTPTLNTSLTYNNADFGFTFSLPENWKGYSIVNNTWEGSSLKATGTKQTGPKLLIRNPKWTQALPYQDIPVMVFTIEQWNSYIAEDFSVSAAPILASELGRNNVYVFALPARWDFDYSEGYQEAQNIIKSNPLDAFNVQNNVSGKLNSNVICEDVLTYMKFPDTASANTFVSECKEGKHPEVIERYKAKMNLKDGVAI